MDEMIPSERIFNRRSPWRMVIAIKDLLSTDESDEKARETAGEIADKLGRRHDAILRELGTAAADSIREIRSDFRRAQTLDEVNGCLDALYDWADQYRVWIA